MEALFESIQLPKKQTQVILSTLAAFSIVVYCTRKITKTTDNKQINDGYDEIPRPPGECYYLGHIPVLGTNAGSKIIEWHKKYGPLLNVKVGVQNWVFIADPRMAHDIFVSNGASTSGRQFSTFCTGVIAEGGRGISFIDYGKNWKKARSAALNILSPTAVQGFHDVLWEEAERSVNQLIEQTKEHGEVDPLPFIRLSSVNIMLTVIYGVSIMNSTEDPFYEKIVYIVESCVQFAGAFEDISSFIPILSFLDVILRKDRKRRDFWHNIGLPTMTKLLEDARKSEKDSLAKRIDAIKDNLDLDDRNVNTILTELLIAGSDTTAVTTWWAYVILCNYPDVQQKIIAEIDEFIKTYQRLPTFEDRLELPYCLAVQKECLRFRPINSVSFPHTAIKDVVYRNYLIPKGTVLVATMASMNHSKDFYDEDPEKFIPERFLNNTKTIYACSNGSINNRDQFSFGWGRRQCPGVALAENELFNNTIRLLARCTIEPSISPSGEPVYPDLNTVVDKGIVNEPAHSKIRFVLRETRLVD